MVLEAIILIGISIFIWTHFNKEINVYEQNYNAARSELNKIILENNELLYEKDLYILKEKETNEILDANNKEIKELKKALNASIAYISELESNVRIDSIVTVRDSIVYVTPNNALVNFSYSDEWVNIKGVNDIKFNDDKIKNIDTNITKLNINTPLTVGITDDYRIFVKTPNPYMEFTDIEGAIIDGSKFAPKKKRFSWGLQIGFGAQYGLFNKKIDLGPYGGVGMEINF